MSRWLSFSASLIAILLLGLSFYIWEHLYRVHFWDIASLATLLYVLIAYTSQQPLQIKSLAFSILFLLMSLSLGNVFSSTDLGQKISIFQSTEPKTCLPQRNDERKPSSFQKFAAALDQLGKPRSQTSLENRMEATEEITQKDSELRDCPYPLPGEPTLHFAWRRIRSIWSSVRNFNYERKMQSTLFELSLSNFRYKLSPLPRKSVLICSNQPEGLNLDLFQRSGLLEFSIVHQSSCEEASSDLREIAQSECQRSEQRCSRFKNCSDAFVCPKVKVISLERESPYEVLALLLRPEISYKPNSTDPEEMVDSEQYNKLVLQMKNSFQGPLGQELNYYFNPLLPHFPEGLEEGPRIHMIRQSLDLYLNSQGRGL